jgi:hypothetical protein
MNKIEKPVRNVIANTSLFGHLALETCIPASCKDRVNTLKVLLKIVHSKA